MRHLKQHLFLIPVLGLLGLCFSCQGESGSKATATQHAQQMQKNQPTGQSKRIKIPGKELNVLLITLDTLRVDRLSVYSDKYVKTPNIDRLAGKSFVFTRAFSHNPITLPAHTNILTGTTPRFHGISDNTGFRLEERFLTIAEYLKEAGYRTGAFIGSFPLDSRFGLNQGFDVYDDQYGTHNQLELFFVERPAEKVIEPALQWIAQQSGQGKDKWFTWIHLFDPHQPYQPPPPYNQLYRHDLYSGEVAYTDASLKLLFDFLQEKQLMDDTVIIIVGDHGEALGEKGEETHSYFAYNNTIHIPLILYIPGTIPVNMGKGFNIEENVCHADIFPTICDILAMDRPKHIQGVSLIPIIENQLKSGTPDKKSRDIYFESLTPYLNRGWAPLRGFIRGNMKFIDLPITEVYNIKSDINENRNIAASSNVKQFKRDLIKLKKDLKGKYMMERSRQVDPEVRNKLKSLGYLSGSASSKPKTFTQADDLKTMLPLQNRMLAAIGKYQNGKFREPITELKTIVEESPGFVLVYRHMATIYKEFAQVDKAIEILEYGLKKNPGNVNLMSKLGIMLVEANQPDKAIELLNICIRKAPFDPENFNFLGVAYYKKGNGAKALENYRKALELDNNYASVFNNIGSLYLAIYLKSEKRDERAYELALENFNRALEIDPRLFAAYNGRGAAYKFKNQVEKAIEDWKKTIEINPNYIDAYFNIGVSYLGMGKKASALEYFLLCSQRFGAKLSQRDRRLLTRYIEEARR
ncbi:MAG: sulfatase-like hydrolase/transferase [Candidatus Aminicenantes bacterium]|nr:MAG: sulfatase-like hydrolase/transferase [Candidatus Aminicenantes bacterium]